MCQLIYLCFVFFLVNSRIIKDVPFFVWSDSLKPTSFSESYTSESVISHSLVNLIQPLVKESQAKVVVIYFEFNVQTYEVSAYNTPSSVFTLIQQYLKKYDNSITIPYVTQDLMFPILLGNALQSHNSKYSSGIDSQFNNVDVINNLEDLNTLYSKSNNEKVELLIIELNHHRNDLHEKFEISGNIMKKVEQALNGKKHISIYTGVPDFLDNNLDNLWSKKRDENELASQQNITPVSLGVISPIAGFNYWFPGWFWEIGALLIIVIGITSFGLYQLFNIPVTYKLAQPKKLKNQ